MATTFQRDSGSISYSLGSLPSSALWGDVEVPHFPLKLESQPSGPLVVLYVCTYVRVILRIPKSSAFFTRSFPDMPLHLSSTLLLHALHKRDLFRRVMGFWCWTLGQMQISECMPGTIYPVEDNPELRNTHKLIVNPL